MNSHRGLFILAVAVVILITGAVYILGAPRLISVSPENGATVSAGASLRLSFSRPMQPDSVSNRLQIEPAVAGQFEWEGSTLVFTPSQAWPSGQAIHVQLAPGAAAAGLLPLGVRQTAAWSFQISLPRLAYLYPSDGPSNVVLQDLQTGEQWHLTSSPAGVLDFIFNANGTFLYYSAENSVGGSDIYRRAVPAGEIPAPAQDLAEGERMADCGRDACRYPVLSPQGDYLAYERTGATGSEFPPYPQVWLQTLPSSGPPARPAGDKDQTQQPAWSPGGRLTCYDTNQAAFLILDPRNGDTARFPNRTGQPGAWDPTGAFYIAPEARFISTGNPDAIHDDQVVNSRLIRFDLQKGATQDFTQAENLEDNSPAYSPDGRTLALARRYLDAARWTPGLQLWLMDADGKNAHPLTNDPYYQHFNFVWSPQGDQLAFVRFNQTEMTQPPEVWVVDPQSTRAQQIVIGGYAPLWTP